MLTSKGGRSSLFPLVPRASEVYSSGILSNRKYQVAEIIMVLPVLQLGCTGFPSNEEGKGEDTQLRSRFLLSRDRSNWRVEGYQIEQASMVYSSQDISVIPLFNLSER